MNHADAIKKLTELQPPKGIGIIQQTTPVISFGDFTTAKIATIGINPSKNEFLSGSNLIAASKKRLVDFETLGRQSSFPLSTTDAASVWEGCVNYFNTSNKYWSWFGQLDELLTAAGYSYLDGSACHLDLSPWATDPVWSDLTKDQQKLLVADGKELLNWQTKNNPLSALIFNGRQAFEVIKDYSDIRLELAGTLEYTSGGSSKNSELVIGTGPLGQKVLGWTLNIQNLQATVEEKEYVKTELSSWLKANLNS
jgi:hypothetical protein